MKLVSLNIGKPTKISSRGRLVSSGISKTPIQKPVHVLSGGLEGDSVLNTKHHGGVDQAVYGYRAEDYDWWSDVLGSHVKQTLFGENLTLEGIPSPSLVIGSRLIFDEVILEVTAPRIPCQTLNAVVGRTGFVKQFAEAARSGFYFRVIQEGYLSVGEVFTIFEEPESGISTVDLFNANYRQLKKGDLKKFLSAPIDIRTRNKFKKQLEKLG